jgi:hypothetical protein
MVDVTFANAGTFIISDYVPYLSFITKLQGWQKTFEETRDLKDRVGKKICDIEGHKERAKERGNNNKDYVPDFVDVLLTSSFDDGQPPSDNLVFILLSVSMFITIVDIATMCLHLFPNLRVIITLENIISLRALCKKLYKP